MANIYSNLFFNQPISILDSTASSLSSASLFLYGGATVQGNSNLFTTNISGLATITDSTEATNDTTAALVVYGGIGTKNNLYVKGNAVISGSLTAGSFAVQDLIASSITASNILVTTKVSSASFYAPLATISNIVATAFSTGSIDATGMTIGTILATLQISAGNIYSVSASSGSLDLSTGLTSASAYITGLLRATHNSNTLGNLYTTAGNVGINNTAPSYTVDVTGEMRVSNSITTSTLLASTSVSSGQFNATNATISNIVATNLSSGNFAVTDLSATNITASNILVNTKVSSASVYAPLATISNVVATDISSGTLNVTNVTAASIFANTQVSSASFYAPLATISNIVATATSTGSLNVTNVTAASIFANTQVSSASFYAPLATISNIVATAMSSGTLNVTDVTAASIFANTQVSSASFYAPLATISNVVATAMSSGSLNVTNVTAASIFANTQVSSASVYAPLATISNIVATASSSGTLNVTTGVTSGTLLAINTDDATGVATGGSLTVLGGAAVSKKLYVGTSLYANTRNITPSLGDIWSELSFSASNNQSSAADVTDLVFDNAVVRAFNTMVSITIVRSVGGNLYANFELKGIQKGSGWVVNSSYVGDYTGIVFSISASGQVQYTSTNQLSWTSSTMKFRGYTTSV